MGFNFLIYVRFRRASELAGIPVEMTKQRDDPEREMNIGESRS
jgi:hypothetical protein